jgi:hypothetical protein
MEGFFLLMIGIKMINKLAKDFLLLGYRSRDERI